MQAIFPELVIEDKEDGFLKIDYTTLQFYGMKALVEQIKAVKVNQRMIASLQSVSERHEVEIDLLNDQVKAQAQEIFDLKARLQRLERLMLQQLPKK